MFFMNSCYRQRHRKLNIEINIFSNKVCESLFSQKPDSIQKKIIIKILVQIEQHEHKGILQGKPSFDHSNRNHFIQKEPV